LQGELFSEVVDNGGLAEARARTFFRQVLLGMAYCHRRKLVHRDIKLENLLLTGDRTRPSQTTARAVGGLGQQSGVLNESEALAGFGVRFYLQDCGLWVGEGRRAGRSLDDPWDDQVHGA